MDFANQVAIRREDMDTIVSITRPASTCPEVAINVATDAVRCPWCHVTKQSAVRQADVVHHIIDENVAWMVWLV